MTYGPRLLLLSSLLGCATFASGCLSHTRDDPSDAGAMTRADAAPSLADGGSALRSCGGFAELACGPSEYCDYPDGSFCGGDDRTGVCRPRPTDCLEPGGVTVCGCDGTEYIGECAAMLAGTDVARIGPCVTTSAYDTAMAEPTCAPADGPAWLFTLTTDRATCDDTRTDGSIQISVWHALETATPGTVYELGESFASDGQALVCGAPGTPCALATGSFWFSVFAEGEVARISFDIRTADGRRFAETDLEVALFWCRLGFVGCG